jgi:HTH-type transcriptional regulator/antitoxin HigA
MDFKLKIIKTRKEYNEAMHTLESLMTQEKKLTKEDFDDIELIAKLIQDYEASIDTKIILDAVEAIRVRMEQYKLQAKDLEVFIGSKSRVSDVLSRKRQLSKRMISNLINGLNIPAGIFFSKNNSIKVKSPEVNKKYESAQTSNQYTMLISKTILMPISNVTIISSSNKDFRLNIEKLGNFASNLNSFQNVRYANY